MGGAKPISSVSAAGTYDSRPGEIDLGLSIKRGEIKNAAPKGVAEGAHVAASASVVSASDGSRAAGVSVGGGYDGLKNWSSDAKDDESDSRYLRGVRANLVGHFDAYANERQDGSKGWDRLNATFGGFGAQSFRWARQHGERVAGPGERVEHKYIVPEGKVLLWVDGNEHVVSPESDIQSCGANLYEVPPGFQLEEDEGTVWLVPLKSESSQEQTAANVAREPAKIAPIVREAPWKYDDPWATLSVDVLGVGYAFNRDRRLGRESHTANISPISVGGHIAGRLQGGGGRGINTGVFGEVTPVVFNAGKLRMDDTETAGALQYGQFRGGFDFGGQNVTLRLAGDGKGQTFFGSLAHSHTGVFGAELSLSSPRLPGASLAGRFQKTIQPHASVKKLEELSLTLGYDF